MKDGSFLCNFGYKISLKMNKNDAKMNKRDPTMNPAIQSIK